jgi:hypothetical protein
MIADLEKLGHILSRSKFEGRNVDGDGTWHDLRSFELNLGDSVEYRSVRSEM